MPPASVQVFLVGLPPDALDAASSGATNLRPAGAASSPRDAVAVLEKIRPEVTVVDLDLDERTVAALPRLQAAAPDSRILAITDAADPVRHAAALYAGARGLILKHRISDLLPRAVPKILAGELWFERQLLASALHAVLAARRRLEGQRERRAWLPPRRLEMLALSGVGLTDDEIAARLSLPPGVVRSQISALAKKLGLANRLELVAYAHQSGAVSGRPLGA